MTFQISWSVIVLLKPFMSNFGPAPSLMTMKSSPSVDPRSHVASVRSEGCVSFGAIGPLPLASVPWQNLQYLPKDAAPALIESGDDATGFLIFLPSGLPPGFCALADRATSETIEMAIIDMKQFRRMAVFVSFRNERPILTQPLRVAQPRGGGGVSPPGGDLDFFVCDERAVVGAASQHVGAGRVEADVHFRPAVRRQFGRGPQWRPRRVRTRPRVFPRLDLRRVEGDFAGPAIHEPGHMEPERLPDGDAR